MQPKKNLGRRYSQVSAEVEHNEVVFVLTVSSIVWMKSLQTLLENVLNIEPFVISASGFVTAMLTL
jgi:hypothetical protein